MQSSVTPALAQPHRDALVAYYLGQLVPNEDSSAPENIITPDDLYEYLLIDNQVGAEVDTSRVAQGIASVQQHVHAIYNGMEPGFGELGDTARHQQSRQLWHEAMSEYSIWAGYQMLVDYPENYLDPSLRMGKTEAFQAFEGELAQARLTPDNVQKALGHYLTRFEEASNLDTVCCYIDGENFRRADYYFIGRSPTDPSQYYWRKAALDLDDSSTHVPPSAWSEWKKIDVKAAGTVTHVRAAVVAGRLHLVWLEQVREALDAQDNPIADSFIYRLNVSYLKADGKWTAAICLHERTLPSFDTLESQAYVLVAALDTRNAPEPRLVTVFMKRGDTQKAQYAILEIRTQHWKIVNLGESMASLERSLTDQLKGGPGGAQFTITGTDPGGNVWGVERVEWNQSGENLEGALSRYLELEARHRCPADTRLIEGIGVCSTAHYELNEQAVVPFRGQFGIWRATQRANRSLTLNGAARTIPEPMGWDDKPKGTDKNLLFFGNPNASANIGYNEFVITVKKRSDVIPTFFTTDDGGLFLDLAGLELPKLRYVRLNTTFANELVRKAERSLDGVLGWETQHTLECPIPDDDKPVPMDFNGANGRYFWELFFTCRTWWRGVFISRSTIRAPSSGSITCSTHRCAWRRCFRRPIRCSGSRTGPAGR